VNEFSFVFSYFRKARSGYVSISVIELRGMMNINIHFYPPVSSGNVD